MAARLAWFLAAAALAATPAVRAEGPSNHECLEDEQICQTARLAVDGPSLVEFFRKRTPTPADRKRVVELVEQLDSRVFQTRQQASRQLVEIGAPAVPLLRQAMQGKSLEMAQRAQRCIDDIERATPDGVAAAAARLIKVRRPAGACPILLAHLPFVDDEAVEEDLLDALMTLGPQEGRLDPALVAALAGTSPAARAAAALVAGRSGDAGQRDTVRKLLTDKDAKLRLRAAQGLTAARDPAGISVLVALLVEGPLPVAQQAEDLLSRVAGEKVTQPPLGETDESRRTCRQGWDEWWKANAKTLDLARADVAQPVTSISRRARDVTVRFVTALIKNEEAVISRTTDVPFCLAGVLMIETRADLDMLFKSARNQPPKRTLLVERVVRVEEYAKTTDGKFKEFLDKLRKSEARAVYVSTKEGREIDRGVVIVRVAGSQARVVGIGEQTSKK